MFFKRLSTAMVNRNIFKASCGVWGCAVLLFCSLTCQAQDTLPKNYFINPLDIPMTLAGTFGEIRSDH
jgi:hypothetical protein